MSKPKSEPARFMVLWDDMSRDRRFRTFVAAEKFARRLVAYYQLQGGGTPRTMTVAELRTLLDGLPDHLPVVMLSPRYGTFGSEMPYGIVAAEETTMHRMERVIPASEYEDDETGEMVQTEEETQVWPAWHGIILQGK